jgi:SAM-dependent methyltransferase
VTRAVASLLTNRANGIAQPLPGTRRLSVREGYGLWAATYDADPNPLLALEERKLELLLPDTRHKDVIDLGCGTGRWLHRLSHRGVRSMLGVDFAPEMLNCAARDSDLKPRLVLADCLSLPLPPQSADLILCSFTLGHICDLDALALEMARALRPRAEIFVSDLHPEAQSAGWRCAFRYQGGTVEIGGHRHARACVQQAFQSAGFTLRRSLDAFLGEPERPIFAQGGKSEMFERARGVPALAIDHFHFAGDLNRGAKS